MLCVFSEKTHTYVDPHGSNCAVQDSAVFLYLQTLKHSMTEHRGAKRLSSVGNNEGNRILMKVLGRFFPICPCKRSDLSSVAFDVLVSYTGLI